MIFLQIGYKMTLFNYKLFNFKLATLLTKRLQSGIIYLQIG